MSAKSNLDTKLAEYEAKFNDCFPLFAMRGAEEAEVVGIIENCLKNGTPYEPEYDENTDY